MIYKFEVTYFKESGKLYISEFFRLEAGNVSPPNAPPIPHMQTAVDYIKECNLKAQLPGLQSGKWDGPILVDCDEGYKCLIIPTSVRMLEST